MAKKISQLPAAASVASTDLVVIVDSSLVTRRATVSQLPSGAAPTGTGIPHIVGGVQDAASSLIVNADVHASAAIAASKVVQATGTGIPHVTAGVLDAASSLIVNADVSASAAIAASKVVQATGTGIPHVVAGALSAASSLIVNADVDAAAAVAGTKVAPDFGAQNVVTTGFVSIGATPSSFGAIRLAANSAITAHDSGAGYYSVITGSGDAVYVGTNPAWGQQATVVNVYAATAVAIGTTAVTNFYFPAGGANESWKPITGSSTGSSPYAVHGLGTQAMADANQTPAASVYQYKTIKTTGAITANRTLTVPNGGATDAGGREFTLRNTCTGAFGIVVSTGAGTTVTVANGTTAILGIDSGGVYRVTADV
jgi:hypothetical protein